MGLLVLYGSLLGKDVVTALLSVPIAVLAYLPYGILRSAALSTGYVLAAFIAAAMGISRRCGGSVIYLVLS